MSEKKNIEEYFKESLTGFKIQPSEEVWKSIERSIWPHLWEFKRWLLPGIAAMLLLVVGFVAWYYFSIESTDVEEVISLSEPGNYENTTTTGTFNAEKFSGSVSGPAVINRELDELNEDLTLSIEKTEDGSAVTDKNIQKITVLPDEIMNTESDSPSAFSEKLAGSIYSDIGYLPGLTVDLENSNKFVLVDTVRENLMNEFRKKQSKSHFYTGIYFTPAVMYYPSVKDQFTFTAGLDFGMTIKRFYVETGIAYQKIKEQGIYTIDLRSFDSVGYYNQVQSFEINPLNANEIIYNTNEVVVYDSVDHYTHVVPVFSYEYINMPFTLGYKVFYKDRFTVGIEAGVILSMMVDKQIPVVDFSQPEYRVVLIQNETPERVNTNFRWQLAIKLDMKLVKAMSVSVKPVFNKYLNSIYDTQSGYPDVRPYSMGIQFGIKYGF